jgi:prepilin-type N-terminal cleavage/methylation domain-containing protein/prepilin-type processing-associated H-X9-DG protein
MQPTQFNHVKGDRTGFTLIELLVVISIIAVLAAILFPVFARAREKARQSTCTSNQRQIAASIQMYAQDHEESLPNIATVWDDIKVDGGILVCPTAGKSTPNGYVYHKDASGMALGAIKDPTSVMLTADGARTQDTSHYANVAYATTDILLRHSNKTIVAYVDGHVAATANPQAFTPPYNDSLAAWFNASSLTVANGAKIDCWTDGIAAIKATQSNASYQPTLLSSACGNGHPAVRFTGTSAGPTSSYNALTFSGLSLTNWSVLLVYRSTQTSNLIYYPITWGTSGSPGGIYAGGTFFSQAFGLAIGATPKNATGTVTLNAWSLGLVIKNGTTYTRMLDANSPVSDTGTNLPISNTVTLGLRGTDTCWPFIGDLAEVLIYNRALTGQETNEVITYMKNDCGL